MNAPPIIDLLGRLEAIVFEADARTLQVTYAAGGALGSLGFSADECTGDARFLVKRLHPDDREQFLARLHAVADDGKQRQLEHRMVSADGQERWFRSEMHFVPSEKQVLGVMIDVTEVRRTAESLRTAESRLRQVINNAPVVLFALDSAGVITLSEGSALRKVGLAPGEAVGKDVFALYPDPAAQAIMRRALAGEETVLERRKGETWWETHVTPLFDAGGRVTGATGVSIDLTDRGRAEEASAQSASLLRAALEATADGILVVDSTARIVDFNRHFAEMWNMPPDVLADGDDSRALDVAARQLRDPDAFFAKVRALYAEPEAISHDVIELRDGRIFERDSRPQLVEGRSVGRVWSFRDVTAERRATRRATFLAAASKILAGPLEDVTPLDVIARMTVPWLCDWCNILLVDEDGQVRSAAAYHHDRSKIEELRKMQPDLRRNRSVARVIKTGEPIVDNEIGAAQLSGPLEDVLVSVASEEQLATLRKLALRARMAVPLRARGQIIGAMVFASSDPQRRSYDHDDLRLVTDLAQRAALAIDNQRLYQSSKDAVAQRDEFLSVASHELRTPVTSLQLAVQSALALGTDAPPGFLRHALETAERQTRRLGRLVDSLLDVSRVQAGRLELERGPTELGAIVREVVALLAADARRAGCEVHFDVDGSVGGHWDRARIDQVVTNLLSNAIKYGAGAPVRITVKKDATNARLVVRDHGIGVAASERGRIFERFERAVSAKHYGGLGLGLYIVRRIVDAHGGSVTVESTPGAGAQFTVELPLQ